MATPVVFNAVNYSIPAFGDVGYAQGPGNLSAYLIAIATGTLQPTGGLFSLTADLNFGPNFGLVALYYKTTTANVATAGQFRLAVTDTIDWRNNANTLNLPLGVNALDQLTYNGTVISLASGTVTSVTGTANQIDSTGGTTPILSLSSTLVFPGSAAGTLTGHSTLDLALTGGTMAGVIAMGANKITGLAAATATADAISYGQSGALLNNLAISGGVLTLSPPSNTNCIVINDPTNSQKGYHALFETASVAQYELDANFNPQSGLFNKTAQGAARMILESGPAFGATVFYASSVNNVAPTICATLSDTGCSFTGTTTNNNATSGIIGEYKESVVAAVNVGANTTFSNITSISLTAGDWDVSLVCDLDVTGATSSQILVGLSTDPTATTFSDSVTGSNQIRIDYLTTALTAQVPLAIPVLRASLSTTTSYFVKCRVIYTATTPKFYGRISARRVR